MDVDWKRSKKFETGYEDKYAYFFIAFFIHFFHQSFLAFISFSLFESQLLLLPNETQPFS